MPTNSGLSNGIFQSFIDWLYSSGDISVPSNFHDRCSKIHDMLDNDVSGLINTVLDYGINSASDSEYKVECLNDNLEDLLNIWLSKININIKGVPTGLKELSKEYFKERWAGSSLCILRATNWEKISANGIEIEVPTVLWFVNGSSVNVERDKTDNYKLGSDKYFLDSNKNNKIPGNTDEFIVVQKPFNRWFDQYATPYLIRKGVYKNWLGVKVLQEKSDEVISKILPYLFIIKKGTENLFLQGEVDYNDKELQNLVTKLKEQLEKYKNEKGRTPTTAVPFDQEYSHLIPDLRNMLSEELYRQGMRSILAGLGFIDVIQGISSTRKESVLNPKPFISEVNDGVGGFKTILLDVINIIIIRNKEAHKKLFSDNNEIKIVNSPLMINVETILDIIRSGYDRGVLSIKSYIESLGFDFDKERERRQKELDEGLEDLFYPHLIQNREDIPDRMGLPAKPKKEVPADRKKGTPESNNFKAVTEEVTTQEDLIIAPYNSVEELLSKHPNMKKYPKGALEVFIKTFNELKNAGKPDEYCFPVAWNSLKRYMKKLKAEETKQ
jgi:hypothetical protein